MDRCILVPLDSTALAGRAIPYGKALARALGARVDYVSIVPSSPAGEPDDVAGFAGTVSEPGEWHDRLIGVIDGAIAAARPELIVLASEAQWLLGRGSSATVAEELLSRECPPLLVVRPWQQDAQHRLIAGARIVVPLDGATAAEAALPVASRLAEALGAELLLLRAVHPSSIWLIGTDTSRLASQEQQAEDYLRRIQSQLRQQRVTARIAVWNSDPDRAIIEAATEYGAALIIMASHSSQVSGTPLGSVARRVLWDGSVPLILVQPEEAIAPISHQFETIARQESVVP